jgi:tetratricopeptide (TPR) repeat protein
MKALMARIGVLLMCLARASAAWAGDVKAAEAAYAQGSRLYQLGAYDKALEAFKQAYVLNPAPQYMLRMAQCNRQLGQYEVAIDFYEKYLTLVPFVDDNQLKAIEESIRQLKAEIVEEKVRAAEQAAADAKRQEAERLQRETAERAARPAPAQQPVAVEKAPPASPVYKKWWLWTVVGGVAVGAAMGLGFGLSFYTHHFSSNVMGGNFGPGCTTGAACNN